MTILNLPDRTTAPDKKVKAKNKVKTRLSSSSFLGVYYIRLHPPINDGSPKAPLGSEDAVFHYSANFFNVVIFASGIRHSFLPRGATCG
jgi:hypothetical protein